jgi:hypothetical protein
MSIQIIDGFQVNTAAPIDNRIVASGSVARNAIPYKYEGLRVFDTSDSVAYVYVNGAWRSENSSGIVGPGTINYLTYYTSSSTIGNSLLYQETTSIKTQGNLITINTANGSVTAANFIGAGSGITSIPGANINNGSVNINKLINGSTGQVLVSGVSSTAWVNPSQLSVGTASSVIVTPSSTNNTHYLTFVDSPTSGSKNLLLDSSGITYNPSTNQLVVASGTASAPSLSFTGDTDTGIFSPGGNTTAISSEGSEKVRFAKAGVSIGLGSPIVGMYVGIIEFTRSAVSAGTATIVIGDDYIGNNLTISAVEVASSNIKARINFPTPMPIGINGSTANLCVFCSIEVNQDFGTNFSNAYTFSVICTGKNTNYIELMCFRTDNLAWIPFPISKVRASFVVYSLGYGID